MTNDKPGWEPVYPQTREMQELAPTCEGYHVGMSKRFYAACVVMQGLLANRGMYLQCNINNDPSENLGGLLPDECARLSFQFADELLKQENNTNTDE